MARRFLLAGSQFRAPNFVFLFSRVLSFFWRSFVVGCSLFPAGVSFNAARPNNHREFSTLPTHATAEVFGLIFQVRFWKQRAPDAGACSLTRQVSRCRKSRRTDAHAHTHTDPQTGKKGTLLLTRTKRTKSSEKNTREKRRHTEIER